MKNRLPDFRRERCVNKEELVQALRASSQTIGSLGNRRYNSSIERAFELARYFEVSIEEILIY